MASDIHIYRSAAPHTHTHTQPATNLLRRNRTLCTAIELCCQWFFTTCFGLDDLLLDLLRHVGRDSSVGIATRYGMDGPVNRIPVGARFSAPVQTVRGTNPASYTMGTRSFPGVKRPGRGADHPPPSSAEVKGRVELYIYSPSGPSWPVLGITLLYLGATYGLS